MSVAAALGAQLRAGPGPAPPRHGGAGAGGGAGAVRTVNDFVFAAGLDNINMFKLVQ